jgi:hypothetical protein
MGDAGLPRLKECLRVDVPSMSAFSPSLPAVNGSTSATVGTLPPSPGEGTLAGIADRLGMSSEDLQAALTQGQSIAGLAERQGVPRESVAGVVATQMQRARQYSGQPPLDQAALDRMVDRALDRGRSAGTPAGDTGHRESIALATYASNARAALSAAPAGGTVSLLA